MIDAAAIRAVRVAKGLSQEKFAELLYVTDGTISHWEKGRAKPRGATLRLLLKIAKETGIEVAPSL